LHVVRYIKVILDKELSIPFLVIYTFVDDVMLIGVGVHSLTSASRVGLCN